jgi:hypothetical protein
VAVERITVLEIGVHHSVAAVPAEAFQPGGMHAEIHDSFWATRSAAWSESAFVAAVCTGGWTAVQAGRAGQGAQSRPLSGWLSNGSPCSR